MRMINPLEEINEESQSQGDLHNQGLSSFAQDEKKAHRRLLKPITKNQNNQSDFNEPDILLNNSSVAFYPMEKSEHRTSLMSTTQCGTLPSVKAGGTSRNRMLG